jgi:hypothetical protein
MAARTAVGTHIDLRRTHDPPARLAADLLPRGLGLGTGVPIHANGTIRLPVRESEA